MNINSFKRFYISWRQFDAEYHATRTMVDQIMQLRARMIELGGLTNYVHEMIPHAAIIPAVAATLVDRDGHDISNVNADGQCLDAYLASRFDAATMPVWVRLCDGKVFVL